MKLFMKNISIILILVVAFGCKKQPDNVIDKKREVSSTSNPVNMMTLSENQLVYINNNFALNLYKKLNAKEGNIFFSPYSLSVALSMTYLGANNQTQKEMSAVLGFPMDTIFAPAFYTIGQKFKVLADKGDIELSLANALWAQQDYKFLDGFLDVSKKYYDSSLYSCDFKTSYEKERVRINEWVSKQTKDKIKDLIPIGVLDDLTRLVLTNAIYFKGIWQTQFNKKTTRNESFFVTSKKEVKVPMMNLSEHFGYFEDQDVQMVELPYKGKELSMVIILPAKKNALKEVQEILTYENFKKYYSNLNNVKVRLFLPRFKTTDQFQLKQMLVEMGMQDAFSMKADFSKMDGTKDLFIAEVVHKAFVDVNEEGSEAAAATAVVMELKSMSFDSVPMPMFRADHPFIYMIVHRESKSILFMGRFTSP